MKSFEKNKFLFFYILKFIGAFCIIYFGTTAIIGLSVKGRYYSSFIENYLNYPEWLRSSLLHTTKIFASLFGFDTYFASNHILRVKNGSGVRIVYSCLGYGIMSFWIAFIFANKGSFIKKIKWITGGLICIWLINVCRLTLLLLSANGHWSFPLGLNHHTWFNIVSYILIFILIYFFDKFDKIKKIMLCIAKV